MTGKLILFLTIMGGSALGWKLGTPGGLMGSYLLSVVGAAGGLYFGRRWQSWLNGDD